MQLSKIEDVYDIIDKLGKGSFGFVVLAQLKQFNKPKFETVIQEIKQNEKGEVVDSDKAGNQNREETKNDQGPQVARIKKQGEKESLHSSKSISDHTISQDKVALKILEKRKF